MKIQGAQYSEPGYVAVYKIRDKQTHEWTKIGVPCGETVEVAHADRAEICGLVRAGDYGGALVG